MSKRTLRITIGSTTMEASLDEGITAESLWERLPVEGRGNRWGDEIYFHIPFELPWTNLQEVVEPGIIAYWPEGPALCIFWGPTPVSRAGECRAYSPVSMVGRITSDLSLLHHVKDLKVLVERKE